MLCASRHFFSTASAAVIPTAAAAGLVSLRAAPSFVQPVAEMAIGRSVRDSPASWVPAYVIPDVISPEEEEALMAYVDPAFDRVAYRDAHVDGLIHHYKEFYRSYKDVVACLHGGGGASLVHAAAALERVHALAARYLPQIPIDDRMHCLRLAGSGFIRAHVDESRNSSGIVAGLCLKAGRVMTLTHPQHPGERVDMLLTPRCFYILIGRARYEWEHSVDWVADDDEHIRRVKKSLVVEGSPIMFDGHDTGLRRDARTAIIFRGVSPMHLLAHRMAGEERSPSVNHSG